MNDWELTKDNLAAQFGDLSNLSVYGLNMDGYSAYLDNVYFKGIIESADGSVVLDAMNRTMKLGDGLTYSPSEGLRIKGSVIVDGSGEQVTLPNYKGLWGATTSYSKGDTVTYQGTTYIYVYALPTSGHAPTETGYWSVYAKAGDDTQSVRFTTDNGSQFINGKGSTTITAHCYVGGTEVTTNLSYEWQKWIDGVQDTTFTATTQSITVTGSDVKAVASWEIS